MVVDFEEEEEEEALENPGPLALPELVRVVGAHSLRALVNMAQSRKEWLQALQAHKGSAIVLHAGWHPAMRALVRANFAAARETDLAAEFPLGDANDLAAPWPLLLQNWVRWNAWLLAAPDALLFDHTDPQVRRWNLRFCLFPSLVLFRRTGTPRGEALMWALFRQLGEVLTRLRPTHHLAFADGPILHLLRMLAAALQTALPAETTEFIITLLHSPGPIKECFDEWVYNDLPEESGLHAVLRQLLPRFFFLGTERDDIRGKIYALDRETVDMVDKFDLPDLLPLAIELLGPGPPSDEWQERLAQVAHCRISWVEDHTWQREDPMLMETRHAYSAPVRDLAGWDVYKAELGWLFQ
jgi:hypothetical protein